MTKPREFWIYQLTHNGVTATVAHRSLDSANETMEDPHYQDPRAEIIHVREVLDETSREAKPNIDWDKVWAEHDKHSTERNTEIIQQLVERALKGEL